MNAVSAEDVRSFVLAQLQTVTRGMLNLPHDFDFLESGALDSLGIIELIGAVERKFAIEIDFAELDADQLTIVGPFCRYVAERSRGSASQATPAALNGALSRPASSGI